MLETDIVCVIFSFQTQVSTSARETVTAFTEDDLKSFYYNPALVYVQDSIEDFITVNLKHCLTLERQVVCKTLVLNIYKLYPDKGLVII